MTDRVAPVLLTAASGPADEAVRAVLDLAGDVRPDSAPDVGAALLVARRLGERLPSPGVGATAGLWSALATLGAWDLTLARVVEPHLDACAILDEARRSGHAGPDLPGDLPGDTTWGVYAAEGGPRLHAVAAGDRWSLSGHKPWCSLADRVSHALVTAWVDEERRSLFVVDLSHPGVRLAEGPRWVARGLAEVRSTGLELDAVPATPVGGPGWYLDRPGFAWGGIGVAAIWYGGAVAVARRMWAGAQSREPDQIALAHLGAVDAALASARAVLHDAASVVDDGTVPPPAATRLAQRVRQVVAVAAEEVLARAGHALGPAPLAREEAHARRVADLGLYLRQHHAERDAAALGAAVLSEPVDGEWSWW